ncbi:hypothetical protein AK830_g8406 [Neonectria ditissima]|uniref:Histidine-specific methyltransferase SAM-dependent domain-containing protein n=1 Tax=Neonectria ditissima TaxID=78410 RepID=A0A0P7B849_9HYPO|nr:hypothetical protein AK830_g8406 [Neonectria ditissima]
MAWDSDGQEIIDIGGSRLNLTFEDQLPKAFAHKADFPKEVAYTSGMDKWADIADHSYQTSDEMTIIEATASEVVSELPSGTKIIDLGAANSMKFEPYVREFLKQGKTCVYVPLDLCRSSLAEQGSFQHGDAYFNQIPGTRLFLSLGSIFYNAPDEMCQDRCAEFRRHLSASDRLIAGQDGPAGTESAKSHASYNTKEYNAFFTYYLEGIQSHAGIEANAKNAWSYTSKMVSAMHYFEVIALETMVCKHFDNFVVKVGTTYKMFPSWKRGEAEIHQITKQEGLDIKTLGKAENSGMYQYLIQAE